MKRILSVTAALMMLFTACGSTSDNTPNASEIQETQAAEQDISDAVSDSSEQETEIVQYYTIDPDKEKWTYLLEDDGSLSFIHNELEGVYFNIGKNDPPPEDMNITAEAEGEMIKSLCEQLGVEVISDENSTIGGIDWFGGLADMGEGDRMKMLGTVYKTSEYNLVIFFPDECSEAALSDIEEALKTFEFTED